VVSSSNYPLHTILSLWCCAHAQAALFYRTLVVFPTAIHYHYASPSSHRTPHTTCHTYLRGRRADELPFYITTTYPTCGGALLPACMTAV